MNRRSFFGTLAGAALTALGIKSKSELAFDSSAYKLFGDSLSSTDGIPIRYAVGYIDGRLIIDALYGFGAQYPEFPFHAKDWRLSQ